MTLRPRIREGLTLHEYERALELLGLDPDEKLTREAIAEVEPTVDQMEAFLELVLEDAQRYDLRRGFTLAGARQFVGVVFALFLTNQHEPQIGLGLPSPDFTSVLA